MNNYRRSGALLIVIVSLVTIPLVISAEPVSGTETVLFTLSGEPFNMILEEDRLFWIQDSKYLNASERGLYGYNLTEGTKRQLVRIEEQTQMSSDGTIPTMHQVEAARFSGDRIVFSEKGIMLMNISTGSLIQLTNQNDAVLPVSDIRFNQNPSIDGDRVVWTEHEGLARSSVDGGTIVILNLATGERQYLPTSSPGNQSAPMVSGNFILWKDYRHGGQDDPGLYLFDLKNGEEERLPTENPLKSNPFISGDDVVWTEKKPGMIVHFSISSRTRTIIGQGYVHQGHLPPVSDDRVVWLQSMNPPDFRERRCAIMVMDLRTGEKSRITPFRTGLSHPVISGDRVIFTRGAGEDWSREPREVVLYTLTARDEETVSGTDTRPGNGNSPTLAINSLDKGEAIPPTLSPGFTFFTLIAGCAAALAFRKVWQIYALRQ